MILSIPLGPNVDFTRSATAVAQTKEAMRASAPCKIKYFHELFTLFTTDLSFSTAA